MSYINVYPSRINWENEPSIASPINATNLNKIDYAVYEHDQTLENWYTTKANQSDLLLSVKSIDYNTSTGVFVFTWQNGTTKTVDLNIEKIPVSFSMDANGVITMTTDDGTQYTADVGSLIKTYTFNDSTEIDFTTTTDQSGNKTVTASIKDGSIVGDKLEPNYLADCQSASSSASGSADDAEDSAEDAEAWAVGQRGGTDVPSTDPTYHNNSKYWAEHTSSSLSGLTDTNITSVSDGQILKYDNASGKWVNSSGGGGAESLDDLDDVDITSASDGQFLVYNNSTSKWVNASKTIPNITWSSAVSCAAGSTSCTITDAAITTSSIVEPFIDDGSGDAIPYSNVTITTGQAVISFDALESASSFKVRITN